MDTVSIIISASVTVLAFGLLIVSLVSYLKNRNTKLIFISLVFTLFLVKGIFFSLSVFNGQFATGILIQYLGVFDLFILASFFLATLKR